MSVGAMLGDLVKSLFKKTATRTYPFTKEPAPERFRGKLVYKPETCVGCMMCVRDCPSRAIEIITVDKATKKFVMKYYEDRCTYCAQCVENCRFSCLNMSSEQWELASTGRQAFEAYYGREEDIQALLERKPAEPPAEAQS